MGGNNSKLEQELELRKEENRKLQEENQRLKDEQKRQDEEQQKLKEEQQRLKEEQQRLQDEQQRSHDEQMKLKNENRDLELKSAKAVAAEREAELRRVSEELEQNKRSQKILEDLRILQAQMREEKEKARILQAQMREEKEKARIREEQIKMDNLARQLEENANAKIREAAWMQQEAERIVAEGKEPIKYPTGKEIAEKRANLGYQEGSLHIAITGCSGSGKSSLINAVRGYDNPPTSFLLGLLHDAVNMAFDPPPNARLAQIGTSETTTEIGRYPDPHHDRRGLIWYDVPGAGTINVPHWQYFNNLGLYVFDAIMIVVGDRITKTDVDLLFHCKRFEIPTFFVRSKADQHIRNSMPRNQPVDKGVVRTRYIDSTRAVFDGILADAGMPPQKLYIVSNESLQLLNDGKRPKEKWIIDEEELIRDITDTLRKWLTLATADESMTVGPVGHE